MSILALDIGGANLKAADGLGFVLSMPFPLWKQPDRLAEALAELITRSPPADRIVATMTGELADCFETKVDGVGAIVRAFQIASAERDMGVYLTDGTIVGPDEALARPLLAAASNWHALARFAGRSAPTGAALLIDIGSTTCDIIPLYDGQPVAKGRTDPERLAHGELVYTGVRRSPICSLVTALPWRGLKCSVAGELFATTADAYLALGDLAEEPDRRDTADGRPATLSAARYRLARMICADRDMFSEEDARASAVAIARAQLARIGIAVSSVLARTGETPAAVVISGEGEFLARRIVERLRLDTRIVSLATELGPEISAAAPAHALAVLARDE